MTKLREDVAPYAADFAILAFSSPQPEPFGRALIEAKALGVPQVIFAHGGAVEIVRDGVNGMCVRPGVTDGVSPRPSSACCTASPSGGILAHGASRT